MSYRDLKEMIYHVEDLMVWENYPYNVALSFYFD